MLETDYDYGYDGQEIIKCSRCGKIFSNMKEARIEHPGCCVEVLYKKLEELTEIIKELKNEPRTENE